MKRKICIITGANSGIGKEAASQIAGKGYHVILACRNRERGEAALQELRERNPSVSMELMIVDMGLQSSIRRFAAQFTGKYDTLDVLIHNAAIFDISQKERTKTEEGIETIWAVNHLGPVLLTDLLLGHLKKSGEGRIITVSSQGLAAKPRLKVDLDDPEFDTRKFSVTKAYYQSKRAQVMYTYWLADRLKDSGVTVNSIRVSAVQIDISRHPELSAFAKWIYSIKSRMSITPARMAETYTWLAVSPDVTGVSGKYYNEEQREVRSVKYTYNKENQRAVMDLTMEYITKDA